jgi:hypothetical protein
MTVPSSPFVIPGDLFARHQTIAGLRALADFLETNPAVPVPVYGWTLAFHTRGETDACERAELHTIAGHLDQTPTDNTATGGHLTVCKTFGRITYQAVHIPARRMDAYQALMSYSDNLTLGPADNGDQGVTGEAA